ncbi:hypothetical protein ACFPM3_04130 [Streptomyces coeruleoprunus]|uniref:Uncharacterized protein n=1 Tax=Streptomyces coeruleoprunus TaxID=285563 RepID=A0ABV9X8E5_9ACTN
MTLQRRDRQDRRIGNAEMGFVMDDYGDTSSVMQTTGLAWHLF